MSFRFFMPLSAMAMRPDGINRAVHFLNVEHPDIETFIRCKELEEKKAWALIDAGYDGSFTGEAYGSVFFQNSNNSVRVTDEFMRAVIEDREWKTRAVTTGAPMDTYRARDIMRMMAESAWICGDPGIQFDTTVNEWHPCPNTARINASNPCSEYMFLDDSACNLASLNLMRFVSPSGTFDIAAYRHAISVMTTAMEILVDNSGYPTEAISRNSHDYRPLGLGYANLGALLMSFGLPYDSEAGRDLAAAMTAIMCGQSYLQSAIIASQCPPVASATPLTASVEHQGGACPGFYVNREPFLDVIRMHRAEVNNIGKSRSTGEPFMVPQLEALLEASRECWDMALLYGERYGYRNSQVTVLAPTGTIGFMMDCDTTGIEPDIALVKYKQLAGGGMFKIVNRTVPLALERLGYSKQQVGEIIEHIDQNDTIEGAPHLAEKDLPVFDCAFKASKGKRSIHYMGHIRMMSAVQPFLSGAISKTVNMPNESTVAEIRDAYVQAWKMGLKCVAIYRDGSKRSQPVSTKKNADEKQVLTIKELEAEIARLREQSAQPLRRRLPETRQAVTHKFDIAGHEGYLTVGLFEDGQPGELFITMAKEGSTIGGLMDCIGTLTSMSLQYGVPLEALMKKFAHQRFEPSGFTKNPDIRNASSIIDYVFRWLGLQFLPECREAAGQNRAQPELSMPGLLEEMKKKVNRPVPELSITGETEILVKAARGANGAAGANGGRVIQTISDSVAHFQQDAPTCPNCGHVAVRNGACYKCLNCGESLGCS